MAGYIGSKASVVSSGAERKKTFAITTSTTSLTGLSYTVDQVHVFHNGVRLVDGTDFTATNGTSITLTSAAESGDEVVVVSYATFQTSDTVSASTGGTFAAPVNIDASSATALTVDRTGSDGTILDLKKDGTVVGSISTGGNNLTIDGTYTTTKAGLGIGGSKIVPRKNQVDNDNGVDLGSGAYRFKDLYLSGGVYLGGTGSANKLDDYEEGTWTPTIGLGTTTNVRSGEYVKVGNIVHFSIRAVYLTERSSSATISFTLPFAASSTTLGVNNLASVVIRNITLDSGYYGVHGLIAESGTTVNILQDGSYKPNAGLRYDQLDSAYNSIVLHGSYYTA